MDAEDHKRLRDDWATALKERLKERFNLTMLDEDDMMYHFAADYQQVNDDVLDEGETALPDADDIDHPTLDKYLQMQVLLPHGDALKLGRVMKRDRDDDGNLVGKTNANPILNTALYEVEFEDGIVEAYAANTLAENIHSMSIGQYSGP